MEATPKLVFEAPQKDRDKRKKDVKDRKVVIIAAAAIEAAIILEVEEEAALKVEEELKEIAEELDTTRLRTQTQAPTSSY
jgi:hypothetical protein